MELNRQKLRKLAPKLDPLRLGTGWKLEDLDKPQIFVESTFGDSHPGSGHLDKRSISSWLSAKRTGAPNPPSTRAAFCSCSVSWPPVR